MFNIKGNVSNMFFRYQGYTQQVFVRNTECNHNFFCLKENWTGSI